MTLYIDRIRNFPIENLEMKGSVYVCVRANVLFIEKYQVTLERCFTDCFIFETEHCRGS